MQVRTTRVWLSTLEWRKYAHRVLYTSFIIFMFIGSLIKVRSILQSEAPACTRDAVLHSNDVKSYTFNGQTVKVWWYSSALFQYLTASSLQTPLTPTLKVVFRFNHAINTFKGFCVYILAVAIWYQTLCVLSHRSRVFIDFFY